MKTGVLSSFGEQRLSIRERFEQSTCFVFCVCVFFRGKCSLVTHGPWKFQLNVRCAMNLSQELLLVFWFCGVGYSITCVVPALFVKVGVVA